MFTRCSQNVERKGGAFHFAKLKRGFESGELNEDTIENAYETHFVLNMDNGLTLGLKGNENVKYADFVSGGDPINMVVRLTGGKHATIQPPILILKTFLDHIQFVELTTMFQEYVIVLLQRPGWMVLHEEHGYQSPGYYRERVLEMNV